MNFLVDAQLPQRATAWLSAAGGDAIHTLDHATVSRYLNVHPAKI